jgi:general secretion pathway protein A
VYLRFYGLTEKPFNPTPDPRFLYLTSAHREALAQLEYGVKERRGFIVLTGEVGTGKTTLLRTLLDRLDNNTEAAFVFNSMMSFDQILAYVVEDFGIVDAKDSHAHRLVALNHFLTERVRRGLNTVLIIDEAQNLDAAALEQVRLLSNFETTNEKLLQILLVGQPELKAKLALPQLRQLKQRIGLHCTIHPLSAADTAEYIHHRLTLASAPDSKGAPIFTDGAVERICAHSHGIPRVVNLICDHCLLVGYADQKRTIDVRVVEEAIDYHEERALPTPEKRESPPPAAQEVRAERPEPPGEPREQHRAREAPPAPFWPTIESIETPHRSDTTRDWPTVEEGVGEGGFRGFPKMPSLPVRFTGPWLVSAAMAATVGGAVFLALAPSGALVLVERLAGSLQELARVWFSSL